MIAAMKRIYCAGCDAQTSSPDEHGYCGTCSNELAQVRQRLRCSGNCKTPLACMLAKKCDHPKDETPEQFQLI